MKLKMINILGQMMYMEEWESICFLGIPMYIIINIPYKRILLNRFSHHRMYNLRQMFETGLFINDFAMHDSSRDIVLTSTQQAAELKLLLDQVSSLNCLQLSIL